MICFDSPKGEPPRTISVPRPAMLVEIVTAPRRPAWDDFGFPSGIFGVRVENIMGDTSTSTSTF